MTDPQWWRRRIKNDDLADQMAQLSDEARLLPAGPERAVIQLLSDVCGLMLTPEDWNNPFEPWAQLGGRRSWSPEDLDQEQADLLRTIVRELDQELDGSALRARLFDIAWTYVDRSQSTWMRAAIDAYRETPLTDEVWFDDGRQRWERALELVVRQGKAGRATRLEMASTLRAFVDASAWSSAVAVQVSTLLFEHQTVPRSDSPHLAEQCVLNAERAREAGSFDLERSWEYLASCWYARAADKAAQLAASERRARAFKSSAFLLRKDPGRAILSAGLLEQAIAALLSLPRTYQAERDLDKEIAALRRALDEDRERVLDSMQVLEGEALDVSVAVKTVTEHVARETPISALHALAGVREFVSGIAMYESARDHAATNPVRRLFPSATFTESGQKVATSISTDSRSTSGEGEQLAVEVLRDFSVMSDGAVRAFIRPALNKITLEHRFQIDELYELCSDAPLVPPGRALAWARGILHGLNRDFLSAASVLAPQIEAMIRHALKSMDVYTRVVEDGGTEVEKGLPALLDEPATETVFGEAAVFEMRSLMVAPGGPNFRNNLAHGLARDETLMGASSIHLWWIAVRFACAKLIRVE